ncbi:pectinesterase family protein [Chitinophaga sedimenti]|uniref:pectinesterase family protein n=1 Tax=Chitinophaga sedimenti TaxID=2033606 RepID=UPI00200512A9|nr:pectinesterase family protein [Chitinophaga sedimenti]MCK7554773.1 pectinesterase family protein [Chitinophaga sedimenti]
MAKDGSGDFTTVQEAINAVPDFRKKPTIIFIKKGIYKEKLVLANCKNNITFIGEQVDSTIITYDDFASRKNRFGEEVGTSGSSGFYIFGSDFTAQNITFSNTAGPVGQAVAVFVSGDHARFYNCRFTGFQDTLYTYGHNSRQYYKNCYIEGAVDFIFGSSTAVFESCTIYCRRGGYITAASTPDTSRYGYVFLHCNITGDAPAHSFHLGRPWRPYAKTVFIGCQLGAIIKPEGWNNWGRKENEQTVFYGEMGNTGPGATLKQRVPWAKQLSNREDYTLEKIFGDWAKIAVSGI